MLIELKRKIEDLSGKGIEDLERKEEHQRKEYLIMKGHRGKEYKGMERHLRREH